ncbi:PspC domain-containing protein [Sinomonas sp. B1-1]|uniref:PspC domain-containing protein n=1 Tax=Sinomonas sp. B1-1 TaxID=3141454 RepID=UPI003D2C5055
MSSHQAQGAPGAPIQPSGHAGTDFFTWVRTLGVSRGTDRWAGGVASGLAHRWGVDPILVRGLFVVASILLGAGLLVYGVLWLLLPEPDGRIHLQQAIHGHWTGGMTGALVASVLGLGGTRTGLAYEAGSGGPVWGAVWGVFWLAVAVLIVTSIARSARSRRPGSVPPDTTVAPDTTVPPDAAVPPDDVPPPLYASTVPYGPAYGTAPAPSGHAPGAPAPTVVRPSRPGPGGPYATVVVGLAVIVAAVLLAFQLAGNPLVDPASGAIWAVAAAVVGLGIIVAGLRGRSSGILSFFAVVALAGAAITQPAYQLSQTPGVVDLSPSTVAQATAGYSLTGASGQLDLRALDTAGPLASDAAVPVDATMSSLKITVPKDVPVRVEADSVLSTVNFGSKSLSGITAKDSETYNADRAGSALVVRVHATMSSIEIRQER